jgi:hypothetical protein
MWWYYRAYLQAQCNHCQGQQRQGGVLCSSHLHGGKNGEGRSTLFTALRGLASYASLMDAKEARLLAEIRCALEEGLQERDLRDAQRA